MTISLNMVLQYLSDDGGEPRKVRIIWINPVCSIAYYVPLEEGEKLPERVKVAELESALENHELRTIQDPYQIFISEDNISSTQKKLRDEEWQVVEYLWSSYEPEILFKQHRSECIENAAEHFNIGKRKIKRIMIRFWQRGMTKNALLSDYINCGGKGKRRKATHKKRGCPRNIGLDSQIVIGINITPEIQEIFIKAIKLHYKKANKPSVILTYYWMLMKWFSDRVKVNGKRKIKIWDKDRIPSKGQFRYWLPILTNKKDLYIGRHGKNRFDLEMREMLGNSTMETFGPRSRYQIDATLADVYILNQTRTRIIGRPVVYHVFDVFTRLTVGVHVCLEGPCWLAAAVAINSILEDKVELCKRFGLDVLPHEWPNSELAHVIIADRGEFEGKQPDRLCSNLLVTIENTSARRGDLKGIVERSFRTLNEHIKRLVPGAVEKEYSEAKARGRDYRLDATLTLYEITQIILNNILLHNGKIIEDYPAEPQMYFDEVELKPITLWEWGNRKRFVPAVACDKDTLKLNTLPIKEVSITREGIKFDRDLFYSCQKAIDEQWFLNRTGEKIKVVYDPRNPETITIPHANGKEYTNCSLLAKSKKFARLTYEEILYNQELMDGLKSASVDSQNQLNADRILTADEIVKNAKRLTKQVQSGLPKRSNRKQIQNIRKNRAEEKELIGAEEALRIGNTDELKASKVVCLNQNDDYDEEENELYSMLIRKRNDYGNKNRQ